MFPVIADAIARAGDYRSKNRYPGELCRVLLWAHCWILPLWFMKDAYVASLQARGKDWSYIDGVFRTCQYRHVFHCHDSGTVCALLGGWFGQRMLKKHFAKTGIILWPWTQEPNCT